MKAILRRALVFFAVSGFAASAYAIPTLQVGAPGAAGEGTYANYIANLTSPTEADTAITSGAKIYVGGAYKNGANQELLIGGQYTGSEGTGLDWSAMEWVQGQFFPTVFDGKGAVLVASVPDGVSGMLKINGLSPFFTSSTSLFPNLHDPVKDTVSDFMFFDIGDFAKSGVVQNFADETGSATGEIKTLMLATSGFQWIHFDVMALVTTKKNGNTTTGLLTSLDNNPGSHDVTWKDPGGPPFGIPEPSTYLLLGLGLMGLLMARRTRHK